MRMIRAFALVGAVAAAAAACSGPARAPQALGSAGPGRVGRPVSTGTPRRIVLVLGKGLVLRDPYRAGQEVEVWVRNDTRKTYVYNPDYEACSTSISDTFGQSIRPPAGTHCDAISYKLLRPGETARLFEWSLDECVVDEWGCEKSRPLVAGTYTIEVGLYPPEKIRSEDGLLFADRDARPATASVTFEIVGSAPVTAGNPGAWTNCEELYGGRGGC